jgi:hypothetical protein
MDVIPALEPVVTMEIALNALVVCSDGPGGICTNVIVNRATRCVTQLVVKTKSMPRTEYLVPLELVVRTSPKAIQICCRRDDLIRLSPFDGVFWVKADLDCFPDLYLEEHTFYPDFVPVKYHQISPIEVAIYHDTRVEARDGRAGWVERFMIDPADGRITSLMLKTGHLWGRRLVSIPGLEIDRFEQKAICLKIVRTALASMQAGPVHRR